MHGFQNNFAQLLSSRRRSAVRNVCSRRLKVKVTQGPPPPPPQKKRKRNFYFGFGCLVKKKFTYSSPPPLIYIVNNTKNSQKYRFQIESRYQQEMLQYVTNAPERPLVMTLIPGRDLEHSQGTRGLHRT